MLGNKNYTPSLAEDKKKKLNDFVPLDLSKLSISKNTINNRYGDKENEEDIYLNHDQIKEELTYLISLEDIPPN
jgi:hypothetical protein